MIFQHSLRVQSVQPTSFLNFSARGTFQRKQRTYSNSREESLSPFGQAVLYCLRRTRRDVSVGLARRDPRNDLFVGI